MANRFYTVMIVPEKTSQVRKFLVPTWVFRGAAVGLALVTLVGIVMIIDYSLVMNQIGENKTLKLENRKLRQQVQIFKNKMTTIDSTMERVKTFATRLKVITNIEDHGGLLQSLNQRLPDASLNTGAIRAMEPATATAAVSTTTAVSPSTASAGSTTPLSVAATSAASTGPAPQAAATPAAPAAQNAKPATDPGAPADSATNTQANPVSISPISPEDAELRAEYEQLDLRFSDLNRESLYVEQMLQDQYELLADQKAFLSALPTRRPAIGYFTSGFGIRLSPFGGRAKMHEGLDIANRPGTQIKSPADGVVIFANTKSGYGQTVIVDHGYGLETWYGHTKKILVTKGQHVKRGDTLALLGNTGRSTGPHVHYEVRVHGTPVDPLSYILEN